MSAMTIALLGQPNSGKSTLFNGLTGSRQHVGNWPGKTVEQKEGYFLYNNKNYKIVDLPGTYSLSANSEEEIVTREYIESGQADLVCIIADASQLERSLFMVADYIGVKTPTILLLNMIDVATHQGKVINSVEISKKLKIPVVPISVIDKNCYGDFFKALEKAEKIGHILSENDILNLYNKTIGDNYEKVYYLLPSEGIESYSPTWLAAKIIEQDKLAINIARKSLDANNLAEFNNIISKLENGSLLTGDCKFQWIENLLKGNVNSNKNLQFKMSKFDKIAISKTWGKPVAIGIIILGLIFSMVIAVPLMTLFGYIPVTITPFIYQGLMSINVSELIVSLLCDGVLPAVVFALMMSSFVFGISLVFGFLEEIGYMARISYVFDNTMSKLGLQGKAVMPFLVSFGCNIGGVSGTRVIDSWGQRVTAIAISWVVPCAATWGVVGIIASTFFGKNAIWVILSLVVVALIHMFTTSKLFGQSLIKKSDRSGLIMELPPYHKARYKNLFSFVLSRMGDVLKRALKIIILVSVIFWALSYTSDGNIEHSFIYKIGTFIEPITMWFGLRWQMFMSFIASAMGKEGALGVLSSLFNSSFGKTGIWGSIASQKSNVVDASILSKSLLINISKAEALAFIYAFFFNMPCIMTVVATSQESHSVKWTLRIVSYYIFMALLMSTIAYHIGLLIF